MAIFFNRATLSYNDTTTTSNTVSGEITGSLTINKTALSESYSAGDTVTYVVNVTNTGQSPLTELTLSDDLGSYLFSGGQRVPLTYVTDSVRLFTNGAPLPQPTVTSESPLTLTGLDLPAGQVLTVVYNALVNSFAPLAEGSEITNTVNLSSPLLGVIGTATEVLTAENGPMLSIEKALSPSTVAPNGRITYTFTIRNSGASPAVATDNLVLSDLFDPILSDITVTYNGASLTSPDGYTYDTATGEFSTVQSVITVPGATFTQDPVTGEWSAQPGIATVTVTGTV